MHCYHLLRPVLSVQNPALIEAHGRKKRVAQYDKDWLLVLMSDRKSFLLKLSSHAVLYSPIPTSVALSPRGTPFEYFDSTRGAKSWSMLMAGLKTLVPTESHALFCAHFCTVTVNTLLERTVHLCALLPRHPVHAFRTLKPRERWEWLYHSVLTLSSDTGMASSYLSLAGTMGRQG